MIFLGNELSGNHTTHVRGDLLQWARQEQHLTMRDVRNQGGPSPSYQSDVEHGRKREVSSKALAAWVRVLQISERFARGQIPCYLEQPDACAGLAVATVSAVVAGGASPRNWKAFTPDARALEVLCMIPRESPHLTRVVLAYVLGLSLQTLDAVMTGRHPIMAEHIRALERLTMLPKHFFMYGEMENDLLDQYLPVFWRVRAAGISPEDLLRRAGL